MRPGIFCLRGGYGTVRILDRLDLDRMRAAGPTQLYGSSDVTALHEWLRERLGVATWFTPMIGTLSLLDDEVAWPRYVRRRWNPLWGNGSVAAKALCQVRPMAR